MTSNAAFKKRVRDIAAELGVPYAEARSRLLRYAETPLFIRRGLIVHSDPAIQPPTYLIVARTGEVSLDRIEGGRRDQLPPYSADVCDVLNRLKLVAAVRRRPRAKGHVSSKVTPQSVYFYVDGKDKADRAVLMSVLYQAWLGNAEPARLLADQWRSEIPASNPWHGQIAELFGEGRPSPVRTRRAPRRRLPNLSHERQQPFADLERTAQDADGFPILLAEVRHENGYTELLTGPCPFCGQQHIHGGTAELQPGDPAGSRAPHCVQESIDGIRDYVLVVAGPGQIEWPTICQALNQRGTPCRKPPTTTGTGRDVLCKTHRADFQSRTDFEQPVRWIR